MNSKNLELASSFFSYCVANPELRFWQALRGWSGFCYIGVTDDWDVETGGPVGYRHTFYWKGKEE